MELKDAPRAPISCSLAPSDSHFQVARADSLRLLHEDLERFEEAA